MIAPSFPVLLTSITHIDSGKTTMAQIDLRQLIIHYDLSSAIVPIQHKLRRIPYDISSTGAGDLSL